MHVDNVVQRCVAGGFLPNIARQHLTGDHVAKMTYEVFEQLELPRCEIQGQTAA